LSFMGEELGRPNPEATWSLTILKVGILGLIVPSS
jgi:hypothetical protein